MGVKVECKHRGCEGVSLMHWNVSRPQSGEGKKRDLWHGQPYHTGAHGSLLLEISCSAPLPHFIWTSFSFLSIVLSCSVLVLINPGSCPTRESWMVIFLSSQRLGCSGPFTSYRGQLALTLYSLFDWTKPRTASGVLIDLLYLQ